MIRHLFFICVVAIVFSSCSKNDPQFGKTMLVGKVTDEQKNNTISPAFIFSGGELLAVVAETGKFQINSFEMGKHSVTCSAIGYADQTKNVEINDGHVTTVEFNLTADNANGKIYGEFHDLTLYQEQLLVNPAIGTWNSEELFDGVSGATMQRMTILHEESEIQVAIGDSIVAFSDGYGQYWFELQCGTYELAGSCIGYKSSKQTVQIKKDEVRCVNFILAKD